MKNSRLQSKRAGITLVGLIIGMALSTFLIAAILQIFTTMKNNYKLAQNLTELDSAMNYAITRMTDIMKNAGYVEPANVTSELPIIPQPYISEDPVGQPIIIFTGSRTGNSYDCLGNSVAAGTKAIVRFGRSDFPGTSLKCENLNESFIPIAVNFIISGLVEDFRVRYGYDLSNNGGVQLYSAFTNNNDRNRIRAIQIALLLHSREDIFPVEKEQKFSLWGEEIKKNGKKIYRLQTFTIPLIHLPNPLP